MFPEMLQDAKLYEELKEMDRQEAARVRAGGCQYCGKALHTADYGRTLLGLHAGADAKVTRWSFCCAKCRLRTTPASVRFLSRRLFLGVAVVLACALRGRVSQRRVEDVAEAVGADRRTIERWCRWWRERFGRSRFWVEERGKLDRPVLESALPGAMLDRFPGAPRAQLVQLMKWLSPITGPRGVSLLAN